MTVFFRVGDFQLTAYGLCILAGALAGGLLCLRKKEVLPALAPVIIGAVLMGHFCWVMFCPKIYADDRLSLLFQFGKGGYTMYGALTGGVLGALAGAKMLKLRPLQLLDTLAPAACAVIFFGRIGDWLSGQGFGNILEEPFFFPVSYCSYADGSYREYAYAVWAWEALAALVLMGVLLIRFRKGAPEGRVFAVFLIGLGTIALTLAAFAAAIAAIVFAEFVFDKYHMSWMLYLSQAAAGILVFALVRAVRGEKGLMAGGIYCGISLWLVFMHFLNGRGSGTLWLYTMMAVSAAGLAVIGAVSLPERQ